MELQSTVAFREIDIDKMLEHTTLDDFLRGLYVNTLSSGASDKKHQSEHERMMSMIHSTGTEGAKQQSNQPRLKFEEDKESVEMFRDDNLRKQALQNLKELRQKQKQS